MKQLRKFLRPESTWGFIPLYLGVFVAHLGTTQSYILNFTVFSEMKLEQSDLISYDFFRLTIADIEHPLFLALAIFFLLRIKRLKLWQFILLFLLIAFVHTYFVLLLLQDNNPLMIAIAVSLTWTLFIVLLATLQFKPRHNYLTFAIAFFFSEVVGIWLLTPLAFIFSGWHGQILVPELSEFLLMSSDRALFAMLGGIVFFFFQKRKRGEFSDQDRKVEY